MAYVIESASLEGSGASTAVRVRIKNLHGYGAILAVASYDGRGKMLACRTRPISTAANVTDLLVLNIPETATAGEVRVFVADPHTYRPLSRAKILK